MENEREIRRATLDRLDRQVLRLRGSIDAGHRRIIDLKQGAIQARAVRREQDIQLRLNATARQTPAVQEAEELIAASLAATTRSSRRRSCKRSTATLAATVSPTASPIRATAPPRAPPRPASWPVSNPSTDPNPLRGQHNVHQ